MNIYIENLIRTTPSHLLSPFNFLEFNNRYDSYEFKYTNSELLKIVCNVESLDSGIKTLKFTNNPLVCWADMWLESKENQSIDPRIESIDLSKNTLEFASFYKNRPHLKTLNLSHNTTLKYVNLRGCSELKSLNLSGCTGLDKVVFGDIGALQELNLRNCNMSLEALNSILKGYAPKKSPIVDQKSPVFSSYVDLRGNYINWYNTKIASKIRMLLTNNILVLWDQNPPDTVIPIQYYRQWQT